MRLPKQNYEGIKYFVTITTVDWIDVFTFEVHKKIIIDSLDYCRKQKGLLIHGYVLMTNHLHAILDTDGSQNLWEVVRDFKKFTTKEVRKALETDNRKYLLSIMKYHGKKEGDNFKLWQNDNHPEAIEQAKFFQQKLNYIHENPVKKLVVDAPEHYVYSSARNYYLNDQRVLEVDLLY